MDKSDKKEEENSTNGVTFRFESGSTQDDMLRYVDTLREKLTGKVPEEQLEYLISSYISSLANVTVMCDGCRKEITDEEKGKLNGKFTFACRVCPMKYDLCYECQKEDDISICPEGFGCNESAKESSSIFIPKQERESIQTYTAFGQVFRVTDISKFDMDSQSLRKDSEQCSHYMLSVAYIVEKEVSHELLRDLWLYFRSIDFTCLEKYGKPKTMLTNLGSSKLHNLYKQVKDCFSDFISIDIDENQPLMLRMIYPNGDEFIIRRLYGEERLKLDLVFVTMFLPLSKYVTETEKSSYNIEAFRESLEKKTFKTIEELNKTGQVIQIVVSKPKN